MASDGFPHPSFTLIGGKWYMTLNGEVITVRPIELAQARGTAECVHCAELRSLLPVVSSRCLRN
jgi:hypothetical protein